MQFFHFFTVSPVEAESHELPRVLYQDYMIAARSIDAAWKHLSDIAGSAEIAEVWGAQRKTYEEACIITGPRTEMAKEEFYEQHLHWVGMQAGEGGPYTKFHAGPVSLEQWREARLAQFMVTHYPSRFPDLVASAPPPAQPRGGQVIALFGGAGNPQRETDSEAAPEPEQSDVH
ncbi:hypothetical protein [Acidovorax sp. sic0104]|uniref:hypothetical protein n=1 Tax=Acidovorax sp. sic0104 TaxID=2854784 RepID=UPI001C456888|nr:hypothetical protein [Acidovorax sp. sic0104]MBV7542053.1 hypothetical protein [Acidovorax sp. sic0104]